MIPAARSIRGIPDKKINTIRITMSDEMMAQVLNDAGIVHGITCTRDFAGALGAKAYPGEIYRSCTLYKIKICGFMPGCFP